MKNKFLPFSLLVLLSAFLLFSFTIITKEKDNTEGNDSNRDAAAYLAKIRNNQHTGLLNVDDVLLSRQQIVQNQNANRSTLNMDWQSLGPDNFSGRTRAIIWDNQDSDNKTLFAAGVTGGIWKSTTAGLVWSKINGSENNLFVSCMTQSSDGTIFAGTGELFDAQEFSVFGKYSYDGGLQGTGVFKSTDGENFTPVDQSQMNNPDWAYVSDLAYNESTGKLWAATNSGLKYSSDNGQTWGAPDMIIDSSFHVINSSYTIECDSFEVQGNNIVVYNPDTTAKTIDTISVDINTTIQEMVTGNAMDVKVASDGSVIAMVDGYTFLRKGGTGMNFFNIASVPTNPYFIVKDSINSNTSITAATGADTSFQETIVNPFAPYVGKGNDLPNFAGRIEYAFAPSDPNIIYASAVHSTGYGLNVYRSNNQGDSWYIILPGSDNPSSEPPINIWGDKGVYANTIEVLPENPDMVLVGGTDMWEGMKINETGFFNWLQKSNSAAGNFLPYYCNADHHAYVFHPGFNNQLMVVTDGGIFLGLIDGIDYTFQPMMKGYMTSQFYTISSSGIKELVLGGAQERGTIEITGHGNTAQAGNQIWAAETGGACAISLINPEVYIYSSIAGTPAFRRSEDAGVNWSATAFLDEISVSEDDFLLPALLWESFTDDNSRDSVKFYARKSYNQGDYVQARSNNFEYPFYYQLPFALAEGDSIMVKDKVQAKYFLGARNHVWMTLSILDFTSDLAWWDLANNTQTEFEGTPSCFAASSDANHLFVGTLDGKLFRISNIALAYTIETADCNYEECIVATKHIPLIDPSTGEENTQAITSVAIDPQNDNRLIVTLGNYGNENYIFMSDDALDSLPDFKSIQGDPENGGLPLMPVYSSIIEMKNSNMAIVGSEHGIFTSSNIHEQSPEWSLAADGMGNVPVMMLKQQLVDQDDQVVMLVNGIDTLWFVYPGTDNFGSIYGASYGRGLYRSDKYELVGIDDPIETESLATTLKIYPNPVTTYAYVNFELNNLANISISIYDINGRLVDSRDVGNLPAGTYDIKLSTNKLTEGSYILQLNTGTTTATGKFIILK